MIVHLHLLLYHRYLPKSRQKQMRKLLYHKLFPNGAKMAAIDAVN